jgi:hypothetical protein
VLFTCQLPLNLLEEVPFSGGLAWQTNRLESSPRGVSNRIVRFTCSACEPELGFRRLEPKLGPVREKQFLRWKHAVRRQFMVM